MAAYVAKAPRLPRPSLASREFEEAPLPPRVTGLLLGRVSQELRYSYAQAQANELQPFLKPNGAFCPFAAGAFAMRSGTPQKQHRSRDREGKQLSAPMEPTAAASEVLTRYLSVYG